MQRTGAYLDRRGGASPKPAHPMRYRTQAPPGGYLARFEGGPWDGSVHVMPLRASGGPWDFQSVDRDGDGLYALAGAADAEGRLPYWWMSWERVSHLQQGSFDSEG